jgi:hypothetical protein
VIVRKAAWAWDGKVLVGAILLGVVTSAAAGWAASVRTLRQKPLLILRNE